MTCRAPHLGEAPGKESVVEIAERQRDAERRQDPAVDNVLGHVDDAERQAREHDDIEQDVGEQPKEAVPVARHPQARPIVQCQCLLHSTPSDPSCIHDHRSRRNDAPKADFLASPMPSFHNSSSPKNIGAKQPPELALELVRDGYSARPASSTIRLPCPAQEDADNVPATVPTTKSCGYGVLLATQASKELGHRTVYAGIQEPLPSPRHLNLRLRTRYEVAALRSDALPRPRW